MSSHDLLASTGPRTEAKRLDREAERFGAAPVGTGYVAQTRAMATDVKIMIPGVPSKDVAEAAEKAVRVFTAVEAACTRFDPQSPLMRANASPGRWHRVPRECFAAIVEAHSAYSRTHGAFDPRILKDLVGLGYDRSLPFSDGAICLDRQPGPRRAPLGPWRPRFRGVSSEVLIGDKPIDLGGIGKGLAVRWASAQLSRVAPDHLIEAGGDCYCSGRSGDGEPWRIGVEDPAGSVRPLAVLELRDRACTTSSTRVRRWKVNGSDVHHILDATTGRPGGAGLLAVTVIGPDPAAAEVWSKTLFLAGVPGIARAAEHRRVAALWVTAAGDLGWSRAAASYVLWRR